jgi:acetolactate synthase-1/2/3 large subunit
MVEPSRAADTVADFIARFLAERGIKWIFGLCGGHIQPIWDRVARAGIRIIDVRDERAAVHMAHAEAEISGGIGVVLITAGPGVTNAMTGIANAHVARAPVLILSGVPPRPQEGRGALQDLVHVDLLRGITRHARTVRQADHVPRELDTAVAKALGAGGAEPGPAYLDFPTDLLRERLLCDPPHEAYLRPRPLPPLLPDPEAVERAAAMLLSAERPLIVTGRGAREAGPALIRLLDALGAAYLDTTESRGLVPEDHPSNVAAARGQAMAEADLVVTVGRKLDFQLAYGSPAVFPRARFLRIAGNLPELRDNRRGEVEILASPAQALAALIEALGNRKSAVENEWTTALRKKHASRAARLEEALRSAPPGADGRMHPNRLLGCVRQALSLDSPDSPNSIVVADGGDILSFARVALPAATYLDPGALGCLGVGVPFGIAAALARPEKRVVVVTGDGAFGFNAMELDTAARHGAPVVVVVANNGAWQIEVHDQAVTYDNVVGSKLRFSDYAALARALGLHAERIEEAEALPAALDRAFANAPALLDVPVTPEAVSSDARAGLALVPDFQPLEAWDALERARRKEAEGGNG